MSGVIVSGATGFLGGAVVRHLLQERVPVIALGRNRAKLDEAQQAGATILRRDISQDVLLPAGLQADCFIHCAALSSPWGRRAEFEAANIDGTRNALSLARQAGASRFIFISSPSVYFRFADQDLVPEDTPLPPPVNAYAETKVAAEQLVQSAEDMHSVILRPRGLYGPGDTALLPRLLRAARRGPLPLMRDGVAATDLTFINDVAEAVRAAMSAAGPSGRVYNVSGGEALSVRRVAEAAGERAGIAVRWRSLPWGAVRAATQASEFVSRLRPGQPEPRVTAYSAGLFAFRQTLDISRIRAELGWAPKVSFAEGLERTFAGGDLAAA
ncbi:MAG: NAD(P)-dependent oxidoreductase [Hyphomonas sp.]|nr:NAD(P)-dependent oxidoreductase [Hyphomonas sp.]